MPHFLCVPLLQLASNPARTFGAGAELKIFAKKEGDIGDAVVTCTPEMLVGELKKAIIGELNLSERPSALELVAIDADGTARILDTHVTVAEAKLASRACITIRPIATAEAGACCRGACRMSVCELAGA
jgi:hypothetical protein